MPWLEDEEEADSKMLEDEGKDNADDNGYNEIDNSNNEDG